MPCEEHVNLPTLNSLLAEHKIDMVSAEYLPFSSKTSTTFGVMGFSHAPSFHQALVMPCTWIYQTVPESEAKHPDSFQRINCEYCNLLWLSDVHKWAFLPYPYPFKDWIQECGDWLIVRISCVNGWEGGSRSGCHHLLGDHLVSDGQRL